MRLYLATEFAQQERTTHRNIARALDTARNRHILEFPDASVIADDLPLIASSKNGRIAWAKAVCSALEDWIELTDDFDPIKSVYFFTLVDRRLCIDLSNARSIDVDDLRRFFRAGLNGLSYLGLFEPAYYTNIARDFGFRHQRAISWHVHGLIWGDTFPRLKARFCQLNARVYAPIASELKGAHITRIKPGSFPRLLRYVLKTPRATYRLYRTENPFRPVSQKTATPRPGEYVTIYDLLRHFTLDQLAFAGGAGVPILKQIKRNALKFK